MLKKRKNRTDNSNSIQEPNQPTRERLPRKAKVKSNNDTTNTTTTSKLHHQLPVSINNNENEYIIEKHIKSNKTLKKNKILERPRKTMRKVGLKLLNRLNKKEEKKKLSKVSKKSIENVYG